MLRSRRIALIAAVSVFGLAGCGDAPNTTTGAGPAVIRLGAGGATTASANGGAEGAPMADKMMVMQAFDFIVDGTLPELAGSANAWRLPAGQVADKEQVAKMAAVLGIEGEVREVPADQGGGWIVGSADYTGASLTVSTDGLLSWWFNPDPSVYGNPVECVTPAVDPPATTGGSDSSGSSAGSEGGSTDTTVVDPALVDPVPVDPGFGATVCEEPTPPANVPDKAAAEAKARALMVEMGYDPAAYEFETYADEWSANVSAYLLIDGHRSPLTVSVGFGAEGVLTWMSGSLATPEAAGEYPLVGTEAGLARLTDGAWMGYYGGGPMVKAAADTTAISSRTVTAETTPAEPPVTDDSVLVDPPVCDPAADCVPGDYVPETITVHVNDVRLDLTMVWDVDGTVWLLPAYTFLSTDGGMYTVVAVDDEFVQLPDPGELIEPMPIDDTGAAAADLDTAMTQLVGVAEDEAAKVAEQFGWTVRVVERDGEQLAATMDYSETRVNVAVVDGVITAVVNFG